MVAFDPRRGEALLSQNQTRLSGKEFLSVTDFVRTRLARELHSVPQFHLYSRYGEDLNFVYVTLLRNLKWDLHSTEFQRIRNTVDDLGGSLMGYGWRGNGVLATFSISKAKLGLK